MNRLHSIAVLILCLMPLRAAYGYVLQMDRNDRGDIVSVRWTTTKANSGVGFYVDTGSFPFPAADVLRAADASFQAWEDVATSFIKFQDRGSARFNVDWQDGNNIVYYDATGAELNAPRGSGVIAFTRLNWNSRGQITDADIVFNGRDFQFTLSEGTTGGHVDLQAVLTHEAGHFLGLDHTPLEGDVSVRPTMYPYFFGGERTLELDDVAGVSTLYPASLFLATSSISGQVTRRDSTGAFGAHVVAYNATGGQFVVGALSGAAGARPGPSGDGGYQISGLPAGDYVVAIEPLVGTVTADNLGGIFSSGLETDFTPEYFNNASTVGAARVISLSSGTRAAGVDFVLGTSVPGFPVVEAADLPPNTPDTGGPYPISAHITDEDGIASAEVDYTVNGGVTHVLAMTATNNGIYTASIPGQPAGSVVAYRLAARDTDGNLTVYPPMDVAAARLEVLALSGKPVLYVAERRSRAVSVFDTGLEREVARIPVGETPLSLVLSADEEHLFVANSGEGTDGTNNLMHVIDTRTHRTAAVIALGSGPLDVAASPDGRCIYVTNSQGHSISVVGVESLTEMKRIQVSTTADGPFGIAADPDGRRVYVTDIDGAQVLVVDTQTGLTTQRISVVVSPRSLAVAPSGGRLYVSGFDGDVSVVDTNAGQVVQTIDTGQAGVFRIALSPDGRRLYGTDRAGANLVVMDLDLGRMTDLVPALDGRETRGLAVSEDGETVYVTNQDSNDLLLFDAADLNIAHAYKLGDGPRGIAVREGPVGAATTLADAALADFDHSGQVGFGDFLLFARGFGSSKGSAEFVDAYDLNKDGQVNFADFLLFAGVYGRTVQGGGVLAN